MNGQKKFSYEAMGTRFEISVWDDISDSDFAFMRGEITGKSLEFDETYSRFIKTSLVWDIAQKPGERDVPEDLVKMLELGRELYFASDGKFNPLVGFALDDLGYDASYSLAPKEKIRKVPNFEDAVKLLNKPKIKTTGSVLIDLGALGKGYFVDRISEYLGEKGIKKYLVDGSGDIRYRGDEAISAGLEHPQNKTMIIGKMELKTGALCASGIDRRRWGKYNHIIDPGTLSSQEEIIATWVLAENAALADGLATCLFLAPPENFKKWRFEYLILNKNFMAKRSPGFEAELF